MESLYLTTAGKFLAEDNFKKGIASLFQFQLSDRRVVEHSMLGECNVTYSTVNDNIVSKKIDGCFTVTNLPEIKHPDKLWRIALRSKREGFLKHNDGVLVEVHFDEFHEFYTSFVNQVRASISSEQHLELKGTDSIDDIIETGNFEDAIDQLEKKIKLKLEKHSLCTEHIVKNCEHFKSCNKLERVVNEHRDSLLESELGKLKSAYSAIKISEAIVNSDSKTIKKVLVDEKNKDIVIQLCDLLGASSNENIHKAVMETLVLTDPNNFDKIERYLWSASIKFNTNIEIIKSLLSIADQKLKNKKLNDTIFNTVTAMTRRLVRYNNSEPNVRMYNELVITAMERLVNCNKDDDECILTYIRSLANLRHPLSIDVLLSFAENGNRKISAYAMKTIKMFGPSVWDSRVLKRCNAIFFQLKKEQDSSTRTIALSILLESNPDYDLLKHVVKWLMEPEEGYEVKQYGLELLKAMANQNESSAKLLKTVMTQEGLNHYGSMAQRGLSSYFSRKFLKFNNITGLVKSSQHMYYGVTKRGSVDIVLEHENVQYDLGSLDMFTTGLGYFMTLYDDSGKKDTSDENNLPATAGLELTLLGVHIRPFIMFSSQAELMGHIWTGTGTDRTPIIQGIFQMIEHLEYVPLSNGFIAEMILKGMFSLDIAGQLEMSLWNKNAQSVIEENVAVSIQGSLKLDTDIVTDKVDFSLATEGLLDMHTDADFAINIVACMKIGFVDTNVILNTYKSEEVHGQSYKTNITSKWTYLVSGRTFALNQMVNEFCNVIHSQ